MSKLITTRYEYVCYDDASGALTAVPPTYPTVLDTYIGNASMSAGNSYGTANVSGAGSTAFNTSAGATVTFVAPLTNTTFVNISTPSPVPFVSGGSAQIVKWLVGPGQTVTFPGSWNTTGQLVAQACDTSFNLTATAFSVQAMWSV